MHHNDRGQVFRKKYVPRCKHCALAVNLSTSLNEQWV